MSILLILKLYNRYVFLSMEMKAKHKAKSRGVNRGFLYYSAL